MRPLALLLLLPLVAVAQPPDFPAPKTFPPDEATLKKITDKTAELKKATEKMKAPDVLVYLKAAEWIVKHGEWYTEKSAEQTLTVLDAGLERAKAKSAGKSPWLDVRGRAIILGNFTLVDRSIQPYSVRFPDDYDRKKKYRVDVILHGRDATLTEVKFIASKEAAKKGKPLDHFEVEIYGRGNNAYRWAGEQDVIDVIANVFDYIDGVDKTQIVLRGFSMGGAGTWHMGLRYPFMFAVMGPGAGFSTTREYIGDKKFGTQPDYIEKCLHIYDAVDYAENNFNIPIVAYSGEKDKQKLAADLVEAKLKDFKEPHSFTHIVAPGLEHSQPADWQAKLEKEYQKHLNDLEGQSLRQNRVRYVTYTPLHDDLSGVNRKSWAYPAALEKQYEKAVIDCVHTDGKLSITTTNVRVVAAPASGLDGVKILTIDGEALQVPGVDTEDRDGYFVRSEGKWSAIDAKTLGRAKLMKRAWQSGPIDDAFIREFAVVPPTGKPWHEEAAKFADARREEFARNWDKYFRGELPVLKGNRGWGGSVVLFGDPQSNPEIARLLPELPITWTKDELVVNGKKYDPKTHLPVLIYPYPKAPLSYVVINSGHTFREADLKGTNALLYPRLGDWAVLKPKPTKDDPAGFEVVDAGLFDENWQFPKKK